jgi:phage-related protein
LRERPLFWVGHALKELRKLPAPVQDTVGFALYQAQLGDEHIDAKPLKGFGGAAVLEVVERRDGNAYRAVYTVKFKEAVYVLHVLQKKSLRGSATPKDHIELVRHRLKEAEEDYREWLSERE